MEKESVVLSCEEVAEMLRIPVSSARKLAPRKNVDFPRSVKIGRHRRWLRSTVEAYLHGDSEARS